VGERFPEGPLTILFSDVEGSTDLRTQRGDAAAHRILRSHEEVVRSCVAQHDGREVKALGDGFMVAFVSARKALSCAVAIQQRLNQRNELSPGEEVLVRIGINTGEVVIEGDDLYGQAVNAAARIAARAKGGEILVSDIVRQLAGSGPEFTFRDRGRCRLKGFPDRWHLSSVVYTSGEHAGVVPFGERTPFVGREPERAELRRILTQTLQGSGSVVMIGGEPGVGKTRLSEELMARATREGLQTFVGHCYEMEGGQPYVPFVEAFEQALARAPSPVAFRQFLGEEASEVARLVPRLRQLCPDIPPRLELPPEQERRHLFNSVWEVMARTGRAQPAVVVLDDLHWADEPTMLLVQHLVERVADVPVLIIGLYRDSELDVGRPLSRTFEELIRRRLVRRMTLKRLPEEAVALMLAGLAGQEPPARLVAVLYAEAEGNPFFTEEVFKHLAEEGRLFDADGRFRTDLSVDQLDVPESVRLVVGHRLRRLGEDGSKVLGSAAVLGRVFSFELLQVVEEMPEDPLIDVVEGAERVGLIVPVDDGSDEDRFMFAHELIRQTVLGELSAPRRRRLHARTAEALERVSAADLGPQAPAIAHHLLEAGPAADPKRTLHYLALAGEFAMESFAYEDALRHFERALSLKQLATPRKQADLLFGLGQARRSLGYWDQAMDNWREALDVYASLGEVEEAGRLCWALAWQLNWAARWEEAVEIAQRGLASLETSQSPARVGLLALVGLALGFGEQYEAGQQYIATAVGLAETVEDRLVQGRVLSMAAIFHWAYSEFGQAVETGLRASVLLKEAGALWDYVNILMFVQLALHSAGRWDEAADLHREVDQLATRLVHHGAILVGRRERAARERNRQPDIGRYEEFARADLDLNRTSGGMAWIGHSYIFLALADFWQGRWKECLENAREGARLEAPGFVGLWSPSLHMLLTAYAGDPDEARHLFQELSSQLPRPGQAATIGSWQLAFSAVEARAVLGDRAEAAAFYPLVTEAIKAGIVVDGYFHGRSLHMLAGIAADAGGQWDDSEQHFREALRQAESLGQRMERPDILRFYAGMLIERDGPGDKDRARQLLQDAIEAYQEISMPRHEEMSRQLLHSVG